MHRSLLVLLVSVVSLSVFLACGASGSIVAGNSPTKTATTLQNRGKGTALALPTGTPQQPTGAKAIATTISGQVPSFTEQDVTKYMQTHPLPHATTTGNVTVFKVTFLTSQDVTGLLQGETTGFPPNYPMCFVEIQGVFHFSGPPQSDRQSQEYQYAFTVFDSSTGNLLLLGGLAKPV